MSGKWESVDSQNKQHFYSFIWGKEREGYLDGDSSEGSYF